MHDCDNVEIREMLPERAAGALDAGNTARVDAHVAACRDCREELALLEDARRVMHRTVSVDTDRIARAVAASTPRAGAVSGGRAARWSGVRVAASIALAAAGLTTFGIWRGTRSAELTTASAVATSQTGVAALTPAGGLTGLDDGQLNALLDDLGTLEATPAAEPESVVPQLADLAMEEIQ